MILVIKIFLTKIKSEFIHLKTFDHPNIVKVYELYIDKLSGRIHSVMEFIEGKEMFEVIHELGNYSGIIYDSRVGLGYFEGFGLFIEFLVIIFKKYSN